MTPMQPREATLLEFYPDLEIVFERALQQNLGTSKALVDKFKEYLLAMRNPKSLHTPEHPTFLAVKMADSEFLKWLQSNQACMMPCMNIIGPHGKMLWEPSGGRKSRISKICALELAAQLGFSDGVEILLKSVTKQHKIELKSAFIKACKNDQAEVVKILIQYAIERNYFLDFKVDCKRNGLMIAASNGCVESVKIILENCRRLGIDVNHKDCKGKTAFMLALVSGRTEVITLFLEQFEAKGIDLGFDDSDTKCIPIDLAISSEKPEVLDMILKKIPDLGNKLVKSLTPKWIKLFHQWASQKEETFYVQLAMMKKIINKAKILQIDFNALTQEGLTRGITVLMAAVLNRKLRMVQLILQNADDLGIDVNQTSRHSVPVPNKAYELTGTALHFAYHVRDKTIIDLLLQNKNIDVDVKDWKGKTVLDYVDFKHELDIEAASSILKMKGIQVDRDDGPPTKRLKLDTKWDFTC